MALRTNPQIVASFLNLDQSFTNLYELKFKGKKIMEEIINSCWEKELMMKNIKESFTQSQAIIYKSAIENCTNYITDKLSQIQEEFIKKYITNVEVAIRNKEFLSSIKTQYFHEDMELNDDYQTLVLELTELSLNLTQQYERQKSLILKFWQTITSQYFENNKQAQQLKEFILHIGFETQTDSSNQDAWKNKIFALSNQRYNPKRN